MPRTTYHVIRNPDGSWYVKAEGATRAGRAHDSREAAVNEALNLARAPSVAVKLLFMTARTTPALRLRARTIGADVA